nr:immunoglobulin light chain junction region [Macaca mulatta]MPO03737.1 immunoglobulin light chain junction region [Macaca mulatta]MPO03782.1 immunoglobulin light chain junction region [Macaca mulatta]MPO03856.1 immunoglobulin light chain junction region [Macaca mulatta]MPO04304.1 immunoglobulin light chain junction region [Macaca mulatta]
CVAWDDSLSGYIF